MLQDQMSGIDVQSQNRTRVPMFVNLKLYVWVMEKLLEAVNCRRIYHDKLRINK